jgi:hypothetical protein
LQKIPGALNNNKRHIILIDNLKISTCLVFLSFLLSIGTVFCQIESEKKLIADVSPESELNVKNPAPVQFTASVIPRESSKDFDFEKLSVEKFENQNSNKYNPDSIDRTYSFNNPFDIEDLSNPFNLPRNGTKLVRQTKKKGSQDLDKFVSTLFEYKAAPKKSVLVKKPPVVSPSWFLFSLLALMGLFTYTLVSYKTDIKKTFQAYKHITIANQQFRDQKTIFTPFSLISYALFLLALGHFAFISNNLFLAQNDINQDWTLSSLIISILGVSGILFLKHTQIRILGIVFPFKQQLDYYNYIISNGNRMVGLLVAPLLFLMAYSPDQIKYFTLYTVITLLGFSYLYRYLRSCVAAIGIISANKFHFFIYLCSVEIAPLLILLKFLSII